ncbi:2-acyl-glycerophospho-ethanolamine acyltransferase [Virgibacillus phasianinus]|uniref:2-acyl-glycerophospho-ethanolamine acyltransferase n=1 Tax=Virgibacillus phasianinus TaxID=2017483 RepID=A0A220U898_9BACI|nr:2-acyl-glycerophospho-ethanolamine acyltransferase [Virgibacillus phasianinus]ASK64091.1 2-acyl-glycerophospho-ethanolamine acyltransferase [Virgibacillus phasianinus]
MGRKNLKIFTKISFFIALAVILFIIPYIYISIRLDESVESIIRVFALLAFLASLFGIPLSIISMFSKENLAKRIFALIINLLPGSLVAYGLILEFIREFSENPP